MFNPLTAHVAWARVCVCFCVRVCECDDGTSRHTVQFNFAFVQKGMRLV